MARSLACGVLKYLYRFIQRLFWKKALLGHGQRLLKMDLMDGDSSLIGDDVRRFRWPSVCTLFGYAGVGRAGLLQHRYRKMQIFCIRLCTKIGLSYVIVGR